MLYRSVRAPMREWRKRQSILVTTTHADILTHAQPMSAFGGKADMPQCLPGKLMWVAHLVASIQKRIFSFGTHQTSFADLLHQRDSGGDRVTHHRSIDARRRSFLRQIGASTQYNGTNRRNHRRAETVDCCLAIFQP